MVSMMVTLPFYSFAQTGGGAIAETAAAVAEAQARAIDALGVPTKSEGVAKIAGAAVGTKTQTVYNWIETFVRTTLMKTLLDQLVDQIIGYIGGGEDGEPKFVTDWQGLLEDAGQQVVGEFAQEIGAGFLCSPFSLQVQLATLPVPSRFSQRATCTLDRIVGNIENFYNDFNQGGWIGYAESWKPQNNFFGAHLIASAELSSRIEKTTGAKLNEALSGGGFLSIRDDNGNIVTPGKALGDLTSKAIGAPIDFLFNAEQIGDYVTAIANSIINRVIKEGVAGVQSATSKKERDTAVSYYNSAVSQNFNSLKNTLLSQIDQVIAPRENANTVIDSAIQLLNQYKPVLNDLYDDFSGLSKTICPATAGTSLGGSNQTVVVANAKANIASEISQANSTISDFQNQKLNNQAIINLLLAKKPEIEGLQPNNAGLIQLQGINDQIAYLVDIAGAENFQSTMQAQNSAVSQNINQKLLTFNQQLQQCQLTP